jgi:hypothetical protein
MSDFPSEILGFKDDPVEIAGFLARLGYDTDNIASTLVKRFGLAREDAQRIADSATADAVQLHADERADLDRAAVEAEHNVDET